MFGINRTVLSLVLIPVLLILFANSAFQQEPGGELTFDGENDFVRIPLTASLDDLVDEVTLEAWVKVRDPSRLSGIAGIWGDGGLDDKFLLHIVQGRVLATIARPGLFSIESPPIATDSWIHVAMTFDGNDLRLYLNGLEVATGPSPGPLPRILPQAEVDFSIGLENIGFADHHYFGGEIDEVRVWSIARAQEVIASEYQCPVLTTTPGLRGYWKFDEARADQLVLDSSPLGNHGTLGRDSTPNDDDPTRRVSTAPIEVIDCSNASIEGTVLFNGRPISEQTAVDALITLFDGTRGFSAPYVYDSATGRYSITDVPLGTYRVQALLDAGGTFPQSPGDFQGSSAQDVEITSREMRAEVDISCLKLMRLFSPLDNAVVGTETFPTLPLQEQFLFSWEPVPGATGYQFEIRRTQGDTVETLIAKQTDSATTQFTIPLAPSRDNEFYQLGLRCMSQNGPIGIVVWHTVESLCGGCVTFRVGKGIACPLYDLMESNLAHNIEIFGMDNQLCKANLTGPIGVQRSCEYVDQVTLLPTVDTTIVKLDLHGDDPVCGQIKISLQPDRPSTGKVIANQTTSLFPAMSHFDVYIQISIPNLGLTLVNCEPAIMSCGVDKLPPINCTYQIGLDGGNFDVKLYRLGVDCAAPGNPVGQIVAADHTPTREIPPPPCQLAVTRPFIRGDCDGSGDLNQPISDALKLLSWFYLGSPQPPCIAACDANGDGDVRGNPIADAVYILNYFFSGTAPPPAPFPQCGTDLTCLSCDEYGCGG